MLPRKSSLAKEQLRRLVCSGRCVAVKTLGTREARTAVAAAATAAARREKSRQPDIASLHTKIQVTGSLAAPPDDAIAPGRKALRNRKLVCAV